MRTRLKLSSDKTGSVLPFAALFLAGLLGVVGLSVDLGRHYILSTELQQAADAAALAGAYQLDAYGQPATVIARVTAAVQGTPLVTNSQKLGSTPGIITISSVTLLNTIPASDDTPITGGSTAPPYNFVRVQTQAVVSNNIFGRVVGQPPTVTLQAQAVARKGRAVCQITPLAVCNPAEATGGAGAAFNPAAYYGKQIMVRQKSGNNAAWAPGNFGFLDVPGYDNGASGLAAALGSAAPNACFNTAVTTKPGQTNGARNALNTRFDMYENPFFKSEKNNPNFPPAENVTKGYDTTAGNYCNSPTAATTSQPNIQQLGRDTNLTDTNRFGNGNWNCATYWQAVHPGVTAPTGCGTSPGTPTSGITRFQIYRYEIDNNLVPTGGGNGANAREDGRKQCSNQPATAPVNNDLSTDRRVITMAVINCLEFGIGGKSTVPPEAFLNGFLTEPVTPDGDIVMEVIGSNLQGNGGYTPVRSRDWVELVR
jgi:Flp pilus assembly protein TadG